MDYTIERYITGAFFCYVTDGELIGECWPSTDWKPLFLSMNPIELPATVEWFQTNGYCRIPAICQEYPNWDFWIENERLEEK